jgi:hypothetical protein
MGRATITRIDSRSNTRGNDSSSSDEYDGSENALGQGESAGWVKLWKTIFILYLPATVTLEAFLVVLMSSWPVGNTSEMEYAHSIANGWVSMLFIQVLIPILSFFIRSLVGFFMKRRFNINLINRISKNAIIPVMAVSFLLLIFLSTLFAYMTKNFNLFTMITTGFLFISFYFSGIITTLSWVIFVLERDNPYECNS